MLLVTIIYLIHIKPLFCETAVLNSGCDKVKLRQPNNVLII